MSTPPKVSVIVPNYNHAHHLTQRLESVFRQSYDDFEVILLDDNSSDESRRILETYRNHPRVAAVHFNERNSGSPFRQWRKGIEMAKGDWIWIAESDDYAHESFIGKLMGCIERAPGVTIAYCDSRIVEGTIEKQETFAGIKNRKLNTARWSQSYRNNGLDEIENFVLPHGTINNASSVLMNRKILMESNAFDIDLRYIGDKYAFLKLLAKGDVCYCSEPLNYYRDPFNSKHADKFLFYFYEQFLLFDWVQRNLSVNRERFFEAFYANTRFSLFRNWSLEKVRVYARLLMANWSLMSRNIGYNLVKPLADRTEKKTP